MARVKTFANGGYIFPADLNAIQDDYDGRLQAIETTGKLWQPGDLKPSAKVAADTGWLLCDGSLVSRTTYSALFTAIGTTYGAGDGTTTFKLPDLRGRVPMGVGTATGATGASAHALGEIGGEELHHLNIYEAGDGVLSRVQGGSGVFKGYTTTATPSAPATDLYENPKSTGHNNLQPYAVVTWMVKT